MPAFNVGKYVEHSIKSVQGQTYNNWELIVVNDGSDDDTGDIIKKFKDKRIIYYEQIHKGASSARNLALSKIKGEYFCFLDADDLMPNRSIQSRYEVFKKNSNINFVDGTVIYMNSKMNRIMKIYKPKFKGEPYNELVKINSNCYFGNTWMIKRESDTDYIFNEELTHCEDLYFYINISKMREYSYTKDEVLHYRVRKDSSMSDILGLESGYIKLYQFLKNDGNINLIYLKYKIIRIMFLSYLINYKNIYLGIKSIFKIIIL
jgi:glycosyltransferase involved in cell wall biosynthesis|tara:strand:+ start:1601 stop:2386 length:786 start_codon:yes stop_codon:yes gene_type:complete